MRTVGLEAQSGKTEDVVSKRRSVGGPDNEGSAKDHQSEQHFTGLGVTGKALSRHHIDGSGVKDAVQKSVVIPESQRAFGGVISTARDILPKSCRPVCRSQDPYGVVYGHVSIPLLI